MKQHCLPNFYLKGFCDPDTPPNHEPFVWVFDLKEEVWEKRAPINLAWKQDYYTRTDADGKKNLDVEKKLSKVESGMATALKIRLANRQLPTADDKISIALFASFMLARTPAFHEHIGGILSDVADMWKAFYLNNPQAFEALKARCTQEEGIEFPEDFASDVLSKFVIKPTTAAKQWAAFAPSDAVTDSLLKMSWIFFVTRPEMPFVTSDWPACLYNPELVGTTNGPGFHQPSVEFSLPLSSSLTFFAHWGSKDCQYMDANSEAVERFNRRAIMNAQEYIISPKPKFVGEQSIENHAREPQDQS